MGAAIANPVAGEDEARSCGDGRLRAKVQHVDDDGGDKCEGEKEGRAQPVDGVLIRVEVFGGVARDGRKGEPLAGMSTCQAARSKFRLMRIGLILGCPTGLSLRLHQLGSRAREGKAPTETVGSDHKQA